MRERIVFEKNDRIAVIAPHPDDECLGAAAPLILAPDRTDVFVLTDGSHGNPEISIAEEAKIRRLQFEAEMEVVNPRSWEWFGIEDTTLTKHGDAADRIDFTPYTKIFLPWHESPHPDHKAAALMCCKAIRRQKTQAECFMYEIVTPFYRPTHCIDITGLLEEKRRLIRFHADQSEQEEINLTLNLLRGTQMLSDPKCKYAECYLKVDARKIGYNPDLIAKLYTLREDPSLEASLAAKGIRVKRVMPPDFTRGTLPEARGLGINTLLVQKSFRYLKDQGFRYAVSGSVSPAERRVVEKVADVIAVEDSEGAYGDLLRK